MLETEWMDLVRKGMAEDQPTSLLSLFEFETLISDVRLNRKHSGIPVDRLEERMQEEIAEWYENGFSVDALNEMLKDNPLGLALRITAIREAVSKHEQLRRRVSNIDWTRDPERSIAVNLDLSQPDRLDSLALSIPQLMMELAQKNTVDEHFSFIAWRPQKRSRPMPTIAPQNTVEDAMEAILEEMEISVAPEIEEVEEEEAISIKEVVEDIVEPELKPETKHLILIVAV